MLKPVDLLSDQPMEALHRSCSVAKIIRPLLRTMQHAQDANNITIDAIRHDVRV